MASPTPDPDKATSYSGPPVPTSAVGGPNTSPFGQLGFNQFTGPLVSPARTPDPARATTSLGPPASQLA